MKINILKRATVPFIYKIVDLQIDNSAVFISCAQGRDLGQVLLVSPDPLPMQGWERDPCGFPAPTFCTPHVW
ncbi:hypothetical protein ACQP3F_34005, partial [Escherichia coli]